MAWGIVIPYRCHTFFWYDTDFSEFDSADIIDYIFRKSMSYQKKDPSFGMVIIMTTTQAIRDLFA